MTSKDLCDLAKENAPKFKLYRTIGKAMRDFKDKLHKQIHEETSKETRE